MLKSILIKIIESLIAGLFTVAVALVALLWVSSPSTPLLFQTSGTVALATAAIQPSWLGKSKLYIEASGVSVYAGQTPRVDVEVIMGGRTIASNKGVDEDFKEQDGCLISSAPALSKSDTGVMVITQVICLIPLSEPESPRNLVTISVVMGLRGGSVGVASPPLVANGNYAVDGGIIHRVVTRLKMN